MKSYKRGFALTLRRIDSNGNTIAPEIKSKKVAAKKIDYSKYTDAELLAIYNKEKEIFVNAICDANADAKESGTKGFGFIN